MGALCVPKSGAGPENEALGGTGPAVAGNGRRTRGTRRSRGGEGSVAGRIEDYALIGDCQTAALVGRDGSIDWLCVPRFDSGACFAALLGTPAHGRWLLAPAGEVRATRRRYIDDTLVLETEHETADGVVT